MYFVLRGGGGESRGGRGANEALACPPTPAAGWCSEGPGGAHRLQGTPPFSRKKQGPLVTPSAAAAGRTGCRRAGP